MVCRFQNYYKLYVVELAIVGGTGEDRKSGVGSFCIL